MNQKIRAAAIQMLGEVASTESRLERSQNIVMEAAEQGANLVVLPELFNTGYSYHSATHYWADTLNGRTAVRRTG